MSNTKIQWTDRTWNPVRGCSRVSEGCRNCYAEKIAARFSGQGLDGTTPPPEWFTDGGKVYLKDNPFWGFAERRNGEARWTGKVALIPEKLDEPLHWKKPCRIFVNSMSDLFHESLPFEDIAQVFNIMTGECDYKAPPDHTYQILTKRPAQAIKFFDWLKTTAFEEPWLQGLQCLYEDGPPYFPRIWIGVSVEDQATANERIPLLLKIPAHVWFVSYEPALGPVDFTRLMIPLAPRGGLVPLDPITEIDAIHGTFMTSMNVEYEMAVKIDWLIIGGESGPGARPCDIEWIRSALKQCGVGGPVPFVKQLGRWPFDGNLTALGCDDTLHLKDRKGGNPDEWPEDLRVREFPFVYRGGK